MAKLPGWCSTCRRLIPVIGLNVDPGAEVMSIDSVGCCPRCGGRAEIISGLHEVGEDEVVTVLLDSGVDEALLMRFELLAYQAANADFALSDFALAAARIHPAFAGAVSRAAEVSKDKSTKSVAVEIIHAIGAAVTKILAGAAALAAASGADLHKGVDQYHKYGPPSAVEEPAEPQEPSRHSDPSGSGAESEREGKLHRSESKDQFKV